MSARATVRGLAQRHSKLIRERLERQMKASADEMLERTRELSPVDTGQFRDDWTLEKVAGEGGALPTLRGRNTEPYAQQLEAGYSEQAPAGVRIPALAATVSRFR